MMRYDGHTVSWRKAGNSLPPIWTPVPDSPKSKDGCLTHLTVERRLADEEPNRLVQDPLDLLAQVNDPDARWTCVGANVALASRCAKCKLPVNVDARP